VPALIEARGIRRTRELGLIRIVEIFGEEHIASGELIGADDRFS
jgi:hypothetical protein